MCKGNKRVTAMPYRRLKELSRGMELQLVHRVGLPWRVPPLSHNTASHRIALLAASTNPCTHTHRHVPLCQSATFTTQSLLYPKAPPNSKDSYEVSQREEQVQGMARGIQGHAQRGPPCIVGIHHRAVEGLRMKKSGPDISMESHGGTKRVLVA